MIRVLDCECVFAQWLLVFRRMNFADYLLLWSNLHGDAKPSKVVRGWLRIGFALSSLVLRVSANFITVFGGFFAISVIVYFYKFNDQFIAVSLGVLFLAMIDSLDGIVAVRKGQTSRWGAYLDSVVDRFVDVSFATLLYLAGAPFAICLIAASLTVVHEYMRARATGLGNSDVGVITVGEKPTRVAIIILFFLACALFNGYARELSSIASYVWLTTSAIGITQLYLVFKKIFGKS